MGNTLTHPSAKYNNGITMTENCKLCGVELAEAERGNRVLSKDKSRVYKLCDRCKRVFTRTRNQVVKFIEADVFWSE